MGIPTGAFGAVIQALARDQHGVVGRRQLLEAGVPAYAIDNRLRNGRIEGLHRGVYRVVGPVRAELESAMAAILACGAGAWLSHHSAAALWGLATGRGSIRPVDVSTPGRHPTAGAGIRVHRLLRLEDDEVTVSHQIPSTTAARTILDVAPDLGDRSLERMLARAERAELTNASDVARLVARYPGRRGIRALRSVLAMDGGAALTRSEAEGLLLELVRAAQLPTPETNVRLAGFEVDFLWRRPRLVVEVDGYAYHSSPEMFDRDRSRDRALQGRGYAVMRFTLTDLTQRRDVVLAQIAQALAAPGRSSP